MLISKILEARKCKAKALADLVSGEGRSPYILTCLGADRGLLSS